VERIYGRVRHLGRKGELGKRKGGNQRIQKRILMRYGRYKKTGKKRGNYSDLA